MGTTISISAYKGSADGDTWNKFKDKFDGLYEGEATEDGDFIHVNPIHCPYSAAYLEVQTQGLEEFKGSGIELSLWYEEREPDEEMIL